MKVSVVIPAFNEEKLLGACIDSARAAFEAQPGGPERELIVCDNNSTDGTSALAAARGIKTVFEPLNRIAGARNRGAAAASGDWLLFIDADSRLSAATLAETLRLMAAGTCCGGGALVAFDPPPPAWGAALTWLWNFISVAFKLAAGSYLFCRRDAFIAVGGFSPWLYAAEEIELSGALKRWGAAKGLDFKIITSARHISSARKFRMYGAGEFLTELFSFLRGPFSAVRDPARLKIFYGGRR
ncbi:MAG: glycosyltransferase [Elusimicrobiota bacterium]|nr:glycosyltransferase [Elusimicrobiota bacterium]